MKMTDIFVQLNVDISNVQRQYSNSKLFDNFLKRIKIKRLIKKAKKELLKISNSNEYVSENLMDLCLFVHNAKTLGLYYDDGAISCSYLRSEDNTIPIVGILAIIIKGLKGSMKFTYESITDIYDVSGSIKVTIIKEGNGEDLPISKVFSERTTREYTCILESGDQIMNASYDIFKNSITIIVESIMDSIKERYLK